MSPTIPPKLKPGDTIRVIAPACSLAMIGSEIRAVADTRLRDLGLAVTFSRHVEVSDAFGSTSVKDRVEDLHEAFADNEVAGILSVIGGYNSNQLLGTIDWDLIRSNPKVFCGYSDITVLNGAMLRKSNLVTYSGPHYSTFGQRLYAEYTVDYFRACLMDDAAFAIHPSPTWCDDSWYLDQENRTLVPNSGYLVLGQGEATGRIIGGNLCTLNLLQGTEYMPQLEDSILFLEDDYESQPATFDRDFQSLLQQSDFGGVRGVVIGRFQQGSHMTEEMLRAIIETKAELRDLPIIAGADFGHTDPRFTFPVGGTARIRTIGAACIDILEH